jgi:hypothetical protein
VVCRLFCALLFIAWTAERPIADDGVLYCGLWRSPFVHLGPFFAVVPGIAQPVWRILLVLTAPFVFAGPGTFRRRPRALDGVLALSLFSMAVTVIWGVLRDGSAYQAYYQLNAFLTGLFVAALLVSAIRKPQDAKTLGITLVAAGTVRGVLAIYFYVFHVRGKDITPFPEYMTTHDDSVLFVGAILTVLSWALLRNRLPTWLTTAPLLLVLLMAVAVNGRRLAWVQLALGLVVVYRLMPPGRVRRRVNRMVLVALPLVLVYVAVGWGRQGTLFAPLQAFATAGSTEDASSLARMEENANLTHTLRIKGNPLLGTGWGKPYEKITSWYANFGPEWWQYRYLPHNSLLGIAVFSGAAGLFGIWGVVPVSAFLATRGVLTCRGTVERAAAMAAAAVLPVYAAQCFGDVGLQSLTSALVLGLAMAVAGRAQVWGRMAVGGRQASRPAARTIQRDGGPLVRTSPPQLPGLSTSSGSKTP